jgi:hypothetical protein
VNDKKPSLSGTGDEPEYVRVHPHRIPWTDPQTGQSWEITGHWSTVDGRAMLVGLDIRSFRASNRPTLGGGVVVTKYTPLQGGLVELLQPVLRAVPMREIRQRLHAGVVEHMEARGTPAGAVGAGGYPEHLADFMAERYAANAKELTQTGERPRRRQPKVDIDIIKEVARLYREALASPRTAASPAKAVYEQLRAAGLPELNAAGGREQVRKWIEKARSDEYGNLLPPAFRRVASH